MPHTRVRKIRAKSNLQSLTYVQSKLAFVHANLACDWIDKTHSYANSMLNEDLVRGSYSFFLKRNYSSFSKVTFPLTLKQ